MWLDLRKLILRPFMPTPISDALSSALRSDSTVALAALMVIASAHRDLLAWAARLVGAEPAAKIEPSRIAPGVAASTMALAGPRRRNGAAPTSPTTSDGAMRATATTRRSFRRCAIRPRDRSAIGRRRSARAAHRPSRRSSACEIAGLAESVQGKWRLNEPVAPLTPPPKWVAPLIAAREQRAHA